MIKLRRDHIGAAALLVLSAAVYLLGLDLPFGTAASPGPGMLPDLAAALLAAFAVIVLFRANASPPFSRIAWDDVPHALRVMAAAGLATALYSTLGFPVTMALLLFGLMHIIERNPLLPSLAIAVSVALGTYVLLGSLLKTPMPRGIFGF